MVYGSDPTAQTSFWFVSTISEPVTIGQIETTPQSQFL
jgi:hypothetical protein